MKGNPLYILLWLFLILCFACSPGKKEKKYVIGVSQCSMTDIWRQSMIRDMEVEALNHPEIELVVMDASQDNDTQISQIKGFIKKKVDLLIISSNETEPVTPVAVEAYRAGIPTIILDRKINSDEYTTYIGADNYEIHQLLDQGGDNDFRDMGTERLFLRYRKTSRFCRCDVY